MSLIFIGCPLLFRIPNNFVYLRAVAVAGTGILDLLVNTVLLWDLVNTLLVTIITVVIRIIIGIINNN